MGLGNQLKHAWNAFTNQDEVGQTVRYDAGSGVAYSGRPDRPRYSITNERSIISSVYTRLSIDVAGMAIRHVRLDDDGRYLSNMSSGLHRCLTLEANIDQAARAFRQDIAQTLFEHGVAAIVAVDTTLNPGDTGGYDVKTLRVGYIVEWFTRHVKVSIYNDTPGRGRREEITLPKSQVAIIQNPLYSVMNEPNSTLQRLVRKLNLLDAVDEQSSSGKLDLIIQLPYTIRSETKRQQAEERRKDIEFQLQGSKYGIAFADAAEKITQLNRPAENNLLKQVEYLTSMLYNQLGLTEEIMNGTANEAAMINYFTRTIEPIMDAITESMMRTFLTRTAQAQNQAILYFRDPFKLVPISQIAEIADKFARNEILSSNEIRQAIGFKPSSDPKADQLVNSNMPQSDTGVPTPTTDSSGAGAGDTTDASQVMNDAFDQVDQALDKTFSDLGVSG